MKKFLLILIAFYATILTSSAQVGIGNVPNPNSILDLTNSSEKWLILPKPTADPSGNALFLNTEASLFYYNSKLYFSDGSGSGGLNTLTPWKWNGNATGFISSLPGNPVGIGFVPTVTNFLLSVAHIGEILAASGGNASIMVGDPSANHLLIDNNEIMVKTNPTTTGVLKLQEEEGTVQIRSAGANTTATILNVNGSIDASGTGTLKQNGFDLVPPGTIVMWFGAFDASGSPLILGIANTNWHTCDGTSGTPNLSGQFVQGITMNSGTPGSAGTSNGLSNNKIVTLVKENLPEHQHEAIGHDATINITLSGSHSHDITKNDNGGGSIDGFETEIDDDVADSTIPAGTQAAEHTHPNSAFDGLTGKGDGLTATPTPVSIDITPSAFRLAYIMKL